MTRQLTAPPARGKGSWSSWGDLLASKSTHPLAGRHMEEHSPQGPAQRLSGDRDSSVLSQKARPPWASMSRICSFRDSHHSASPCLVPGDSIVHLHLRLLSLELGRAPAADFGSEGFLSGTLCN